jgi:hypothetical protein
MLRETVRETKSLRPLCRKQEFYYASRLRGAEFSKPRAPISVRRWVYTPSGLCNQGGCSRWFTEGQKDKSVTQKQVGCRVSPQPPYRMWSQSQETLQSLAEGLWHFWAFRKLLVAPRVGNSRQILDTVNPRKIAMLAPTFHPLMLWHFICPNASSFSSSGMGFTLW